MRGQIRDVAARRVARAQPENREPVEPGRSESLLQEQRDPKNRRGVREQRERAAPAVERAPAPQSLPDAERQGERVGEQRRDESERDRDRQTAEELRRDLDIGPEILASKITGEQPAKGARAAAAEQRVPVGPEVEGAEIVQKLQVQRPVEQVLGAEARERLRRRAGLDRVRAREAQLGRIAGREPQEHEGDRDEPEQRRTRAQRAPKQVPHAAPRYSAKYHSRRRKPGSTGPTRTLRSRSEAPNLCGTFTP